MAESRGTFEDTAYSRANRLEIQITMNEAKYMGVDASVVPGSISGLCSLMYNEVKMTGPDLMNFSEPGKIQHY